MSSLGETTVVKAAHFFTRLFFYLFLILAVVLGFSLLLVYFGQLPEAWSPVINLPVDASLISLSENPAPEAITLGSASAAIELFYLAKHHPEAYLSVSIAFLLFSSLFIIGFYQLKKLLESATNNDVFTRLNIRRIKTIALLVFLVDPLGWLYREVIWVMPGFLGGPSLTNIHLGVDLEISYWFIGLLLFVLAAIFEKGYEMYNELKLTV